jgi:hypothetical protein
LSPYNNITGGTIIVLLATTLFFTMSNALRVLLVVSPRIPAFP